MLLPEYFIVCFEWVFTIVYRLLEVTTVAENPFPCFWESLVFLTLGVAMTWLALGTLYFLVCSFHLLSGKWFVVFWLLCWKKGKIYFYSLGFNNFFKNSLDSKKTLFSHLDLAVSELGHQAWLRQEDFTENLSCPIATR